MVLHMGVQLPSSTYLSICGEIGSTRKVEVLMVEIPWWFESTQVDLPSSKMVKQHCVSVNGLVGSSPTLAIIMGLWRNW